MVAFVALARLAAVAAAFGCFLVLAGCGFIGNGVASKPLSSIAEAKLAAMGSSPAEPILIRIFKESSELEVWKRTREGSFKLFHTYEICAWSGVLGPKIVEGDRQSPEGFYTITPGLMNPNSNYHLAFNTGFPNKFDRVWGRTGSALMVHGDCSSRGCFAMTDEQIEEIYALARESFRGGNASFQLQIFPFRMTAANLARHAADASLPFWRNIKEGYDLFELNRQPPLWDVCEKRYVFNAPNSGNLEAGGACPALTRDSRILAQQAADDVAFATEVTSLAEQRERDAATAQRAADEQAAIAARGAAIGGFISGLFGGGGEEGVEAVMVPDLVAPVPAPRLRRS